MGFEGNALLHNGLIGFSMWFTYDQTTSVFEKVIGNDTDGYTTYAIRDTGRGDINSNLSVVPLPSTIFLLLGALGLGAVARRRRKT